VSTARVTTARVIDGQLQPVTRQDVDLEAQRQDAVFASAVFVAQLQQALKVLGYYDGDVTGVYDDATTAAVGALQTDLGLPATGQYDAATDAALRARVGDRLGTIGTGVMELQQALADRGYYHGPIDGRFSDETVAAIKAFQTDLGVPPTGVIDVATLQAIYARGVATGELLVPPPPETTLPPKPPPTTVAPATTKPTPTTTKPAPTTTKPAPDETTPTAPPDEPTPTAPKPPPPPSIEPENRSLYEMLSGDSQFTTFMDLARAAGYDSDLGQPGPFTVFAPTNNAFAAMDADELAELEADPEAADALLRDLIVDGALDAKQLVPGPLRTIGGGTIVVAGIGDQMTVGGAAIELPSWIIAFNGVVHGMAAVPTPG
jgi:peptidoglycan hydrolase-like protein with peptidoglycan-binding domain